MDKYEGEMLAREIAYYGATAGLGTSFGLLIGGLIASFTTWRLGFLINVPVCIVIFILTSTKINENADRQSLSLDIKGTICSIIGISGIIYGINGDKYRLISFIIGIVFLILFIIQEKRVKVPIMPLKLFTDPIRVGAYISRFFIIGMCFTYLYLTPQVMQNLYHYTPFLSSIMFLFMNNSLLLVWILV